MKIIPIQRFAFIPCILSLLIGCAAGKRSSSVDTGVSNVRIVDEEPAVSYGELAVLDGTPEQLTFDQADNGIATFHPDGSSLVFQSNRDDLWQIYRLDLFSGEISQLIESESNDEHPAWLGDGSRLIFTSDRNSGNDWNRDLFAYDPVEEVTEQLTVEDGDDWFPTPRGATSIVYLTERNANLDDPSFYRRKQLLERDVAAGNSPRVLLDIDIDGSAPTVLTDGTFIVRLPAGRLGRFNPQKKELTYITPVELQCGTSAYSAANGWLAFTVEREDDPGLMLYAIAGGVLQELDFLEGEARFPQFSPDGEWLVYSSPVDGIFQVFRAKLLPVPAASESGE